ncbi:MAG: sugar transferase [Candidatus Aminicenantes bacterium]|nr:sugar transferase [Candidatus Aminicenantes bacterium]
MEINTDLGQPRRHQYNKVKIFVDFLLLLFAFVLAYLLKKGNLSFTAVYFKFLPIYLSCWGLSAMLSKKLKNNHHEKGHMKQLEPFLSSALYFTGMLSLLIYGLNLYELSRFIVFGSVGIFLLLEILLLSGNYLPLFRIRDRESGRGFSITFFLLEFAQVTASFFVVHFFKIGTVALLESYQDVLLLIYFLWLFTGLLVHRFRIPRGKNYLGTIYPFVKSTFIVLSIASIVVFGFRTGFSRLLVFGSLGIYACIEILGISFYYMRRMQRSIDVPEIDFFEAPIHPTHLEGAGVVEKVVEKERVEAKKVSVSRKTFTASLVRDKLKKIYLKDLPPVFKFIDRVVDLDTVDILKSEVLDSGNPYNVEILPDNALNFFVNLHTLNDFRRVNRFLVKVNRKIKKNGVFIGKFEPCERRYIYFLKNYPHVLASILYFFDFTWKRVFPKLPLLKKFYFAVSKGQGRAFSLAEALGRIYYCGFEIVSLESIENFVYFIVRKVKAPQTEFTPSYGPLFKQRRVGLGGKIVYIYKMRTMHPYSEYIHKYIYDKNKLDEKGKIKGDFRITGWGRFFRKFWIDEIPMWINWLKGDIKLVGVRPLSETFFNTYPKGLQEERIKFKPGMVPPYYADMPKSIEDVWQSERDYLQKYKEHPIRTDFKYFFKAFANIIFRKAKSS